MRIYKLPVSIVKMVENVSSLSREVGSNIRDKG